MRSKSLPNIPSERAICVTSTDSEFNVLAARTSVTHFHFSSSFSTSHLPFWCSLFLFLCTVLSKWYFLRGAGDRIRISPSNHNSYVVDVKWMDKRNWIDLPFANMNDALNSRLAPPPHRPTQVFESIFHLNLSMSRAVVVVEPVDRHTAESWHRRPTHFTNFIVVQTTRSFRHNIAWR